jgi:hypothetical protein
MLGCMVKVSYSFICLFRSKICNLFKLVVSKNNLFYRLGCFDFIATLPVSNRVGSALNRHPDRSDIRRLADARDGADDFVHHSAYLTRTLTTSLLLRISYLIHRPHRPARWFYE